MNIDVSQRGYCSSCERDSLPVARLRFKDGVTVVGVCVTCVETMRRELGRLVGDLPPPVPVAAPLLTAMLSSAPSDGGVRFAVSSNLIRSMFLDEVEALKDNMLVYGPGRESRIRVLNWLAAQVVPNQQLELTLAQLDQLSRLTDNSGKDNSHLYSLVRAMARLAETSTKEKS